MADERTKPPYLPARGAQAGNQPSSIIPDKYSWPSLLKRDGDDLFDHYRHLLEELGKGRACSA
jgi:type I restriction enzyme M protein